MTNIRLQRLLHAPGYINKDLEKIVGLQTDAPLKRAIMPFGGIKMVEGSCKIYGRELDPEVKKSSLNIVKPTTKVYSMFIRQIFYVVVNRVY